MNLLSSTRRLEQHLIGSESRQKLVEVSSKPPLVLKFLVSSKALVDPTPPISDAFTAFFVDHVATGHDIEK